MKKVLLILYSALVLSGCGSSNEATVTETTMSKETEVETTTVIETTAVEEEIEESKDESYGGNDSAGDTDFSQDTVDGYTGPLYKYQVLRDLWELSDGGGNILDTTYPIVYESIMLSMEATSDTEGLVRIDGVYKLDEVPQEILDEWLLDTSYLPDHYTGKTEEDYKYTIENYTKDAAAVADNVVIITQTLPDNYIRKLFFRISAPLNNGDFYAYCSKGVARENTTNDCVDIKAICDDYDINAVLDNYGYRSFDIDRYGYTELAKSVQRGVEAGKSKVFNYEELCNVIKYYDYAHNLVEFIEVLTPDEARERVKGNSASGLVDGNLALFPNNDADDIYYIVCKMNEDGKEDYLRTSQYISIENVIEIQVSYN